MKLASYKVRGRDSFGVVAGEGVVDLKTRLASQIGILRNTVMAEA